LLKVREILRHERTEIRKGTTRIDEGQQDGFAAKILEMGQPAVLVGKLEVGDHFAAPEAFGVKFIGRASGPADGLRVRRCRLNLFNVADPRIVRGYSQFELHFVVYSHIL